MIHDAPPLLCSGDARFARVQQLFEEERPEEAYAILAKLRKEKDRTRVTGAPRRRRTEHNQPRFVLKGSGQ